MIVVRPDHIETYSRCPRRTFNGWDLPNDNPLSFHARVVRDVIQASHIYFARQGRVPNWKQCIGWIDKYVKRETDKAYRQEIYQKSAHMLQAVHRWYYHYFLPTYQNPGLINVPLQFQKAGLVQYHDNIPLILFGDTIRVCDFIETDIKQSLSKTALYNDMYIHARLGGIAEGLEIQPAAYVRFCITQNSLNVTEVKITPEILAKSHKMFNYILAGIAHNVSYPSFSAQCSTCPFVKGCAI